MKKILQQQAGFTIIELMIATLIFSIIILAGTAAIIQIGRMYYKGVISSQTQQTARSVTDQISRPIQFGGVKPTLAAPTNKGGISTGAICIGDNRFTYGLNAEVKAGQIGYSALHQAPHALWKDTFNSAGGCVALDLTTITSATPGEELLPESTRVATFNPSSNAAGDFWTIDTLFIYGDDDLLVPDGNNPTGCIGAGNGSQWCAAAALKSEVYRRL